MNKKFSLLLSVILLQGCSFSGQFGSQNQNLISASGIAEIKAEPDVATFSFTIREEEKDAKLAQQKMAKKAEDAIAELHKNGIEDKDIKTSSYNTAPRYEYASANCEKGSCAPSKRVLRGYEASETVEVKVRNISKAGDILSAISQANVYEVGGLFFAIEDIGKLKAEARSQAIIQAKAEAKRIASDLGVSLGKITSFNEDNFGGFRPMPMMMSLNSAMEKSAAAPPIKPGEDKITSRVTITYQIK